MQVRFDWDDARVVLALWRARKVEVAARQLGIDPTTAVRRLEAFERSLDVRVLERSRHGWKMTPEGEALLPGLLQLESTALTLGSQARGSRGAVSGWVRVTTSDAIGNYIVAPALVPLLAAHPALRLALLLDHRVFDLESYEADIALRTVRPRRGALTAQAVGALAYGLYAPRTTEVATGAASLRSAAAARRLTVVVTPTADLSLPEERWLLEQGFTIDARLRCVSFSAQVAATEAGLGVAFLPCFLADRKPGLVRLAPASQLEIPIWLVRRAESSTSPTVRAVSNHLIRVLRSHPDLRLRRESRGPQKPPSPPK
jgi:DNA-binding transcriptional LysR family regulator